MFQAPQRMFQHTRPNRRGANYQRTIGHRFGDGLDIRPRACSSTACALTAERVTEGDVVRIATKRNSKNPEIAHAARAAAPMFSGLRGEIRTTLSALTAYSIDLKSRRTASNTPLMNATDSSPENWRASSQSFIDHHRRHGALSSFIFM